MEKVDIEKIDFSNAKVGDTVWMADGTKHKITEIRKGELYPLYIEDRFRFFLLNGKEEVDDTLPTIYPWPVEVVIKKKEKKVYDGWFNVYRLKGFLKLGEVNKTYGEAISNRSDGDNLEYLDTIYFTVEAYE